VTTTESIPRDCGESLASVISLLTPNIPVECIQADPEHTNLLGIYTTQFMDSDDPRATPHAAPDKGKQRAPTLEPSERTPLLPSTSSHTIHQSHPHLSPPGQPPRQNLVRKLLIVFFATLLTCVVVLVLILLFAFSYSSRVSNLTAQDILDRGLFVKGPDRVDVLNATKEGVWIRVDGQVGLDMGRVLRIHPDDKDLIWTELWKGVGRWGVRKVGRISVELSPITVVPSNEPSVSLAVVTAPAIELPLSSGPPSSLEWLTPVSIPIHIRPTNRTKDLIHFAKECWMSGVIQVFSAINSVHVTGGRMGETGWRGSFGTERSNVSIAIRTESKPLCITFSVPSLNHFQYHSSPAFRIPETTPPSLHFRS